MRGAIERRGGVNLPNRQRGLILQAALGIIILTAISVFAFQRFGEGQEQVVNNAAYEESVTWLSLMTEIGIIEGHVFTGLDQNTVVNRTTIEDATNIYGLTITAAVVANNWALTFSFPDAASCENVESRILDHPGLAATPVPACNGTNQLVATIE